MARNLAPPPTPTALVPIALVLLLLHAILGADYIIERFQLGNPEWPGVMRYLPLEGLWQKVVYALAVWLGFAAAFFLVIRDNASVLLFFATTVAGVALAAALYATPAPGLFIPLPGLLGAMVIVPLLAWIYARALNRNGVLH
jgi:hypothetical protein